MVRKRKLKEGKRKKLEKAYQKKLEKSDKGYKEKDEKVNAWKVVEEELGMEESEKYILLN